MTHKRIEILAVKTPICMEEIWKEKTGENLSNLDLLSQTHTRTLMETKLA